MQHASQADFCLFKQELLELKVILGRHDKELVDHRRLIEEHTVKFTNLEQRLMTVPVTIPQPEAGMASRPIVATNTTGPTNFSRYSIPQNHNLENFSAQEKRILSVFFQNKEMSLSYLDIAKVLNKSPNTIKNQMHQLLMKADLFDRTLDTQNRNRFKLKSELKIDSYLNVN